MDNKIIAEQLRFSSNVLSGSTIDNAVISLEDEIFRLSELLCHVEFSDEEGTIYKTLSDSIAAMQAALNLANKSENEIIKMLKLTPMEKDLLEAKKLSKLDFRDFFVAITAVEQAETLKNLSEMLV